MPATIDTRKAHLIRRHGDILCIYTWVNQERAMVILAATRDKSPWFIIMESAAYLYADNRGYPTPRLIQSAIKCANVLGFEPSKTLVKRLVDIMVDGLPDLLRMPSAPPTEYKRGSIGEMKLMQGGKLLAGQAIHEEVEGVTYG